VRCCSDTDALLATAIASQPTSFQSCSCSYSFFVEKPRALRPLPSLKNARVVARKREQHRFSNATTTTTTTTTKATRTAKCNWELRAQRTGRH
jgi:hypothetical protein